MKFECHKKIMRKGFIKKYLQSKFPSKRRTICSSNTLHPLRNHDQGDFIRQDSKSWCRSLDLFTDISPSTREVCNIVGNEVGLVDALRFQLLQEDYKKLRSDEHTHVTHLTTAYYKHAFYQTFIPYNYA